MDSQAPTRARLGTRIPNEGHGETGEWSEPWGLVPGGGLPGPAGVRTRESVCVCRPGKGSPEGESGAHGHHWRAMT